MWALHIAGFVATAAVTVYITKLARKTMKRQTQLSQDEDVAPTEEPRGNPEATPEGGTLPGSLPAVALLLLAFAVCATVNPAVIRQPALRAFSVLGPPAVTMTEAYDPDPGPPEFDHSLFADILQQYVNEKGLVDYEGLKANPQKLNAYLATFAEADFGALGRNEKLALLINAYNVCVLKLVIEHYPIESIRDVPSGELWTDRRWRVGEHVWSLNDIEHRRIRTNFEEPRIHFALTCAAYGCPKLRRMPYAADRIDRQLEDQAAHAHSLDRWYEHSPGANRVRLLPLYDWYSGDFAQVDRGPLRRRRAFRSSVLSGRSVPGLACGGATRNPRRSRSGVPATCHRSGSAMPASPLARVMPRA